MNVVNMMVKDLIPYEKNPRFNDEAVKYVANSIKEFGFKVPIIVDKNNIIVAGHTRYKACKELGIKSVPVIVADDLNEEQIKAFRLADNKVSEKAEWNLELLDEELEDLDINMEDFGFDIDIEKEFEFKENERHRTNDYYNLDLVDFTYSTNNFWQMPIIKKEDFIPSDLIGFNYAKTSENKKTGIHFYLDDYQFERIWNNPEEYVDILKQYECILTPDFSLYMDMPMPMKIWNVYRSRQIGSYYQQKGIKVIPTIQWAEKNTFHFCFEGLEQNCVVSVSTIGVKRNKEALQTWKDGMDAMIEKIKPKTILVYGGKIDYDYKDIEVIYYENKVTERMKEND